MASILTLLALRISGLFSSGFVMKDEHGFGFYVE
jgi:hypothetical protein